MNEDNLSLIIRAQAGEKSASDELISRNSGLVWTIVKRYLFYGVDPDDLYQLGCMGFLKAVAGFSPEYGTQFSTYAVPKIAGEIRRFLRDDGTVKVSRSLKERASAIRKERQRFSNTTGREPTISELADALGLTPEQIAAAETATAQVESIQSPNGESAFCLEDSIGTVQEEETLLNHICLQQAMKKLPEKEKMVISLRYFHGLTQEKTAKIIGVSQVQISRIEKKALAILRQNF